MKNGYYIDDVGTKILIPYNEVTLYLYDNNIIEFQCNYELELLYIDDNKLTKLILNDKLKELWCVNNQLKELILK